jgi:hypothetical protein
MQEEQCALITLSLSAHSAHHRRGSVRSGSVSTWTGIVTGFHVGWPTPTASQLYNKAVVASPRDRNNLHPKATVKPAQYNVLRCSYCRITLTLLDRNLPLTSGHLLLSAHLTSYLPTLTLKMRVWIAIVVAISAFAAGHKCEQRVAWLLQADDIERNTNQYSPHLSSSQPSRGQARWAAELHTPGKGPPLRGSGGLKPHRDAEARREGMGGGTPRKERTMKGPVRRRTGAAMIGEIGLCFSIVLLFCFMNCENNTCRYLLCCHASLPSGSCDCEL